MTQSDYKRSQARYVSNSIIAGQAIDPPDDEWTEEELFTRRTIREPAGDDCFVLVGVKTPDPTNIESAQHGPTNIS